MNVHSKNVGLFSPPNAGLNLLAHLYWVISTVLVSNAGLVTNSVSDLVYMYTNIYENIVFISVFLKKMVSVHLKMQKSPGGGKYHNNNIKSMRKSIRPKFSFVVQLALLEWIQGQYSADPFHTMV